ncbi:hypothetical protein [Prosthecobacter sp.]|uniref:hypothetical protein n=1 Tax=Prosthecobacter sp. TaxID=1965333 RepID=UPI002489BB46|nr:hypothetical protein [Prosthecobacter sp.]MDI1313165.1 hypothetical protein [Prosthecobacter sp.]
MIVERFPGVALLPDEDKRSLMADTPDDNPALAEFVEQRWQEYQQHPDRVSPWSDVKARVLASCA